jgi:hypothetical protein
MTVAFDDVVAAIDGVDGWLSLGQAARLYAAASACPGGGAIVEIGSFRGRSTIVLASAADPSVSVLAIDPHAGNDRGPQEIDGFHDEASEDNVRFHANLERAGVSDRVRHLRAFSSEVVASVPPPDVLYIDGAHRFAPARDDIAVYGALVPAGGTMLIHDAFSSLGVTLAIGRLLLFGRRFRYVGRTGSLVEYRADLSAGARGRAANVAKQVAQLPWFARNLALKVFLTVGGGKVLSRLGRPVPDWPY